MMILMLHILYQKHHLDLPKCLVENLMFFTSNISYILNAAANIFKGCGIFDLIFLSNMLLLLLTAANMFMSQIQAIFSTYYLCKKSFQKLIYFFFSLFTYWRLKCKKDAISLSDHPKIKYFKISLWFEVIFKVIFFRSNANSTDE